MRTRRADIGCLVLMALCSAAPVAAQKKEEPPRSASMVDAQRVLLLAYPELHQARIDWRLAVTPTGLVLEAREAVSPPAAADLAELTIDEGTLEMTAAAPRVTTAPPAAAPARLRATVTLDQRGGVVSLTAEGLLARPAAFTALQSSAQLTTLTADDLIAAGATFPPGDTNAAAALVPPALARALDAQVDAVVFRTTDVEGEALTWRADLVSAMHVYTLVFEPTEGRLLSLVRQ